MIKIKALILSSLILSFYSYSRAQTFKNIDGSLYGDWKCIKIGDKGLQKFSREEINNLKKTVLKISKNNIFYEKNEFIDECYFSFLKVEDYDTSNIISDVLETIYTPSELSKFKVITLVDSLGEPSCYNDCSQFFKKDDTLINLCGGYQIYLIKHSLSPDSESDMNIDILKYKLSQYDTVKCKFGAKCLSTGYVIKGSRNDKGQAVHVSPKNKNVPKER